MIKISILIFTILTTSIFGYSATVSYFDSARSDIATVLANSVFEQYSSYTLDNIRQGEIGESQAYFVRLVKPFSTNTDGVCFEFLGTKDLLGKPHSCDKAE